jgi:hypothetical protein
MPQHAMRHNKIVTACRVDKALGAHALGTTERLTALVEVCARGFKVECPYMHAARRNV